jgi:hypothetical protein
MLKTAHIVLGVALALASPSGTSAKSQQPPSQTSQEKGTHEERGSEKAPIVVKVLPTEKTKDEFDREKAKEEADGRLIELTGNLARYTKYLFWATGILAFMTGGLVTVGFFQVRDAKQAIGAAVKSANAAKQSAHVAELSLKSQRAVMFIRQPLSSVNVDVNNTIIGMGFWVLWENGGSTWTLDLCMQVSGKTVASPEEFVFELFDVSRQPNVLGPHGHIESGHVNLPLADITEVLNGTRHLFLWGAAEYRDIFDADTTHVTEFCFNVGIVGTLPDKCSVQFSVYGEHNRQYDKKERAGLSEPT